MSLLSVSYEQRVDDATCYYLWGQLKQLEADHADELGTAARAIEQSIERAESNVEWMSLHYQEVLDWIQQNP